MGWFKKNKEVTTQSLEQGLKDTPSWRLNSTHDSMVNVEFELKDFNFKSKDDLNAIGTATYEVDTDYGGGPGEIEVFFDLKGGVLTLDLDQVKWDAVLDFTTIDEQTDEDYGDGELDSEDDWDDEDE